MKIADVSINRPVFAIMMSLALVTLGIFSYRTLGVDLMPKTDQPQVNVNIQLPGASPEEIEISIAKKVEENVNTINGIDELRTNSNPSAMQANITFNLERDMDSAIQDVRDKLGTIQAQFPHDTFPARIFKYDPDSAPVLTLAISSERDPKELTEIVDKKIKQVLETVNNVGGIDFNGERRRQIQLLLDADRLTAYGLTAEQVRNAIERQNIEVPGGNFNAGPSDIMLRTMGRLANVSDFSRVIISQQNGSVIRMGDIGRVLDTIQELRVTPDKYLPHRYAGASGDFNPIHIDPEFANAAGLPTNILHGLYAMAQVARANEAAAGDDPRKLKRLSVQFRGMGFPEKEIVVSGTVKEVRDGRVVIDTVAEQEGNKIIRNAEAEIEAE